MLRREEYDLLRKYLPLPVQTGSARLGSAEIKGRMYQSESERLVGGRATSPPVAAEERVVAVNPRCLRPDRWAPAGRPLAAA